MIRSSISASSVIVAGARLFDVLAYQETLLGHVVRAGLESAGHFNVFAIPLPSSSIRTS